MSAIQLRCEVHNFLNNYFYVPWFYSIVMEYKMRELFKKKLRVFDKRVNILIPLCKITDSMYT